MTEENIGINKYIGLFNNLPQSVNDRLLSCARSRLYKKNTIVISEGDDSTSFYLVKSGRVKIYVSDEDGKELTLNIMQAGEYFGELSMLDGNSRSTSATTMEKTELLIIRKKDFEAVLLDNPEFALNIIKGLSQLLRQLTSKTRDIALLTVYKRIVVLLDHFATDDNGRQVITPKLSHADIASMVGCRREMVSRIMSELSKGGYVVLENNAIVLKRKLPANW